MSKIAIHVIYRHICLSNCFQLVETETEIESLKLGTLFNRISKRKSRTRSLAISCRIACTRPVTPSFTQNANVINVTIDYDTGNL
ncbi:hypothetical protein RIR_jg18463.t1 [Rhizophagus irregularis DAOM 181602=DAOM 197198]|nr:hypothetical protein RIR_jg18463.t1 [Rhizophagus irregularis DAOM 181602=DAOM 197198]